MKIDGITYCDNPICDWESCETRTRKDGTEVDLCGQCVYAWDMALVDCDCENKD